MLTDDPVLAATLFVWLKNLSVSGFVCLIGWVEEEKEQSVFGSEKHSS